MSATQNLGFGDGNLGFAGIFIAEMGFCHVVQCYMWQEGGGPRGSRNSTPHPLAPPKAPFAGISLAFTFTQRGVPVPG
jgi:hypothetical protein